MIIELVAAVCLAFLALACALRAIEPDLRDRPGSRVFLLALCAAVLVLAVILTVDVVT